jgi:pyrroline-5-carboxylate reductase
MKITVIGCGVMGSAFAKHFAKEHSVILYDRHAQKRESLAKEIGGKAASQIRDAIAQAEMVVLAVKPKDLSSLSDEIKGISVNGKLVMSLLTGASVKLLKTHFPQAQIVRVMPNLGVVCERGVTGLVEHPELHETTKRAVDSLMKGMGMNLWMPENKIDSLIALSGSGIGFVLVMIEAMIDGGIFLGFNVKQSRESG